MIALSGVSKSFGGTRAVDSLSFTVEEGEVVGLVGPNGSGKTTAIRLMCGLLRPDGGTLRVLGVDPLQDGDRVRAASGVLTESAQLYAHLSGEENLKFYAQLYGVAESRRIDELLEFFGLHDARARRVATYSTGMRKRLGLAKALLHRPRLLFLDEPTNGLDPDGTRLVLESLRQLQRSWGTTILICSHLLQQLELVCQRYLIVREGTLLEAGTLAQLREKHRQGVVVEVLSGEPLEAGEAEGAQFGPSQPQASGDRPLWRTDVVLQDEDGVPGLLRRLAAAHPLYGARVRQESLEDIYFRVQQGGGHAA